MHLILQLTMATTNYSFRIPRMSNACGEDYVRAVFHGMGIGRVRRVDFVTFDEHFKSAFVHMEAMYETELANHVKNCVSENGDAYRIHPDTFNPKIYWILLNNTNPVPDTELNIHQVVENHRILEQLVFRQQEIIDHLSMKIDELMARLEKSSA
jgi:hypothetical protein